MEDTTRKIIITRVKEVKGKERVLDFIGSTELPDRDNEVIKASAWNVTQYVKNPVVQWAHNYSEPPIGKTLSISQNKKKETIFEIEFADKETYDFADTIFKLCKGGFLNATSVGFIPIEWEKGEKDTDPVRTYSKVELLEISIVPVPANPEALISARDAGVISLKEFDLINKPKEKKEEVKHERKCTSQEELRDELEFTLSVIKTVGIADGLKEKAVELSNEIRRLTKIQFNDVLQSRELRGKVWTLFDTLCDCIWQTIDEKTDSYSKANSLHTAVKQFSAAMDTWIDDSAKAGTLESQQGEISMLRNQLFSTKRLTGGDTPEIISKSAIRAMLEPVIKAIAEHHNDHNKCHDSVMKMLKDMGETPDTEHPELPDGDEDMTQARAVIQETIKEYLRRNKC